MNPRIREQRILHADQLRARALRDLSRAREALDLIREIAEVAPRPESLPSIGRLARAALAGVTPADPGLAHPETHEPHGDAK